MRILFAGTPEIAVPSLKSLVEKHEVVGVLTGPDRPSGRGRKLKPSAVKTAALDLGIPVYQPEHVRREARETISLIDAELMVVFAYGRIFGPRFLSLFPKGSINIHPSLLPRWRGPSPITAAILHGDRATGITVQKIALEMDSGDIILQREIPLDGTETTGTLSETAAELSGKIILDALELIEEGFEGVPQNSEETKYCFLVSKNDGRIDWGQGACTIERMVRAHSPWPMAWTDFGDQPLKIHKGSVYKGSTPLNTGGPGKVTGIDKGSGILIQTGNGVFSAEVLQLPGRKPLEWRSFLNGVDNFIGSTLGG